MDKKKIFVITLPEENTQHEMELLKSLVNRNEVSLILRKPNWNIEKTIEYLKKLPDNYLKKIIVYQYPALIKLFNCFGIHFPSNMMEKSIDTRKHDSSMWISTSCHTKEEVKKANILPFSAVMLSPVFNTISKTTNTMPLGKHGLENLLKQSMHAVVALGGISSKNLRLVLETNVYGVASIGSIWHGNPVMNLEKLSSEASESP